MNIYFNTAEIIAHIAELVSIPSPAGYTDKIITHIESYLHSLGVETKRSHKGGLIVSIRGTDDAQHRLLSAHVDTLGAMVKEIKDSGRLKLATIGSSQWSHIEGEYAQVFTATSKTYTGTILMHETSEHVYKNSSRIKASSQNMEVRLDERVTNRYDVEKLGIHVGDFVAFDPRFQITSSGFIKSRHLDNKISVGVFLYFIKHIVEQRLHLPYTTHFLFSNHEEVGFGGNSNIPPQVLEYLAVDMGAVGDGQTSDEYSVSICAKDSYGPYNYHLRQHLVQLAQQHDLAYHVDVYPNYSSDASSALSAGVDVVHGLIGAGIDSSHAFERTHTDAILNTLYLIYSYLLSPLAKQAPIA